MIATTVKPMKLDMKILWNSCASLSVRPESEPFRSDMVVILLQGLSAGAANTPRQGTDSAARP
jgi:hypothetical protein